MKSRTQTVRRTAMKFLGLAATAVALAAQADAPGVPPAGEKLGTVSFAVSCAPAVRAGFDRGVALLHDFWYDEARPQFERILKDDPSCAMAHWGVAMSVFHEIWDRPDPAAMAAGWEQLQAARAHPAKTARENEYIAALAEFYRPGKQAYAERIGGYVAAMSTLYAHHPDDVDAGAFYALALLAAEAPDDTSLRQEHAAMTVLRTLYAAHPDNPGVVHYVIHACDTPTLAADGLEAANHYGVIAASGPHAVHMPGHIYARLGLWQADIDANLASVAASHAAEAHHMSGSMDQFHSDDFLVYAYLQMGRNERARAVIRDAAAALAHFESMPEMGEHYMVGMFPYFRAKFPIFYALETRDWKGAAALEPIEGAPPQTRVMTYWARAIADGHLKQADAAGKDLAAFDALMDEVKKGSHAYFADSLGARIERGEMQGWLAFATGETVEAVRQMRISADLQDKVGQGEVDIPAREMLADILLESNQPREALAEFRRSLASSPNRFNGLFNAGRAAEAAGDRRAAREYYAALIESTGGDAVRGELEHAKAFVASATVAAQ